MRRVSVVGNSGSGKSTVAAGVAARLGVAHIELDAVFHQPGWRELPRDEFRRRVGRAIEQPGWVVDGNYSAVIDLVWAKADTVIWVDPPRWMVMGRVIRRSVARVVFRRELWNGNREDWRRLFSTDPMTSIIAWSWTQHRKYHERYGRAARDPAFEHLTFIAIRSRRDAAELLASLDAKSSTRSSR